jgi:hypothetical protein
MNQKTFRNCLTAIVLTALSIGPSVIAQEKASGKDAKSGSAQPSESEMMNMMMEMSKPGENHKHLQAMAGTWSYKLKYWMNPEAEASESSGKAVIRSVLGGRYVASETTGKMQMPGADGKMTDMEFKGMSFEGYDNAKKKFVYSWIDNMGTGIMNAEGTYDAGSKTLTYVINDYEPMPGMKTKMRQTVVFTDSNHHTMSFFEDRGGKEVKTMEIAYTRES